jgi:hypothetical protein
MPLAALASLQWYGPGCGAARDVATATGTAAIKGEGRMAATHTTAPTGTARAVIGRRLASFSVSTPTGAAAIKARGRMAALGKVNELSQDDVTGAVLEAVVEGELSVKQALRLILAAVAGPTTGAGTSTMTFRDLADTKTRISGTLDASGNRTAVTLDGS